MSKTFREMLCELTQRPVNQHAEQLERLRLLFPHSVVMKQSPLEICDYTCGVHAFHLIDDPDYREIANYGQRKTFAGTDFVEFLMAHHLLEPRPTERVLRNDLAVYLFDRKFSHVGRLTSRSRVISKWGQGHLYEHNLWEVPCSYGEEIKFFTGPSKKESHSLFLAYAESKGFRKA